MRGFYAEAGETEAMAEPWPERERSFRVSRSDGSSAVFDANDEADAMRQANNAYVGPAIIVAVSIHPIESRRTA